MNNISNFTEITKNEDKLNLDLSPKSSIRAFKDVVWFNFIPSKSSNINIQPNNTGSKNNKTTSAPSKRWGHTSSVYNKSMLIFGGRHSHRSLVNIYSFDFTSLAWTKVEPLGQTPPTRDSHSTIVFKNELITFGGSGSGKKLNDLWVFNIDNRKYLIYIYEDRWSKLNALGDYPSPREGHSCTILRNNYMLIYGGLDENDRNVSDIFLLDLRNNIWHKATSEGEEPTLRDSQSCTQINNTCFIFGGQGESDKLFNDLYSLVFEINETEKKYIARWSLEQVVGKRPPPRASHNALAYKSQYMFIIGGEGYDESNIEFNSLIGGIEKTPLNDVWVYSLDSKSWMEIKVKNSAMFDGRMCHSASLYNDRIFIYGGMKNADTTFDNLTVLCLDGKSEDLEEACISNINHNLNPNEEVMKNYEKVRQFLNAPSNTSNNVSNECSDDYVFVSNNINTISTNNEKRYFPSKEIAVDTSDLIDDNTFDFESLKKNYLNNMISWSFLKKLSDFNQWPLGCISNFVENSMKEEVDSKNIHINVKCYDKKVYIRSENQKESNELKDFDVLDEKVIVMSIEDDGCGIGSKDFNQILYSFSINEKKEYNFFKYGVSMKASALRLANSFLVITKTQCEASIGLISKNLQTKLDTDFILTPIVNFKIDIENPHKKYVAKSNFSQQSLNLICNEIKFLFKDSDTIFNYFDSFITGTKIFLFDLKQLSADKKELNKLSNYELLFDYEEQDILFNYFQIQIGERNFVDCSLANYLRFFYIRPNNNINLFIFDRKINLNNPYTSIFNISKNNPDVTKIGSNLKTDCKETNCLYIDGELYKGILFNESYFKMLSSAYNFTFENSFEEKEIFNGILIYHNKRLICRLGQNKLGDISFFIKKILGNKMNEENLNLFPISGFIEVPSSIFELLYNKTEFKDQAIYAFLYSKLKNLLKKIKKLE